MYCIDMFKLLNFYDALQHRGIGMSTSDSIEVKAGVGCILGEYMLNPT